jgi:B-box zinc finger
MYIYDTTYVCVCVCMPLPLAASFDIVLPAAGLDDMELCGVCRTSFFFEYKEDKLAQRENIYRELHEAVRKVIRHDRTHHSHARTDTAEATSSSVMPSDSTCPVTSVDGGPAVAESPCGWQYGSGSASSESVSDVCFGALQPGMHEYAVLEDIAHHIVDEPSARRLYERYDDKTGLVVACRRSDRMIDESMNRADFDATPVLLHCGHTVCRGCAYKCVRAHENAKHDTMFAMVDCPTRCNRQTTFVCDLGVEWLPIDIHRIRLLQEHKQQQQQQQHVPQQLMCSEHNERVATSRCTHPLCAKFSLMCDECDKTEHSVRSTRDHVRVPPSQFSASTPASGDGLCPTHQQPVAGICVTDGMPVCEKCVFDHSGHDFKRLSEVCCDWSKKLETLQRETLVRAHVLSGRAASVQQKFDETVHLVNTHFDTIDRCSSARRNKLLFEARRWRKIQLEESKMLAAESSQLSATAMYERMLLQRALAPCDDSKSPKKKMQKKARRGRRQSSRLSPAAAQSSSPSDSAAASSSSSANSSDSVAALASRLPDVVLGGVAKTVHTRGSAIEVQSIEVGDGINAMQAEDLSVVFRSATHACVLNRIRRMGEVNVRPVNIWAQGLADLQSHDDDTSPSSRNSTKRKARSASSINKATSSQQQVLEVDAAASDPAAYDSSGPTHKRRRRDRESDSMN